MNGSPSLEGIQDQTLHQLGYRGDRLYIQAGLILNSTVFQNASVLLLLCERETEETLRFPFQSVASREDRHLLEAELDLAAHRRLFREGAVWNALIRIEAAGDIRTYRLRSRKLPLEAMAFGKEGLSCSLIPYTTNRGNVSFHAKKTEVVARVEQAGIEEESRFSLRGFAYCPYWTEKELKKAKKYVVFRNEDGTYEKSFLAETSTRPDLEKLDGRPGVAGKWAGFHLSVDLREFVTLPEEKGRLKLYMELVNDQKRISSPALEMVYFEAKARDAAIIKDGEEKRKISVQNKKSMELIVTVTKYHFWKTVLGRRWASIKKKFSSKKWSKQIIRMAGKLGPDPRLVLFESFYGKQYSCNPRAIYEYLRKNHPEYRLYWSVEKGYFEQFRRRNIPCVRRFSLKWLYLMGRAGYWVFNTRMPLWVPKLKHTVYVQTWHGTPLKKLACDIEEVHMPSTNTEKYRRNFVREAKKWDYLISPNPYSTLIFWRAFQYEGKMIETGYPRNDVLVKRPAPETIKKIKKRCGIPLNKKVILYAPTWRDDQYYARGRYKFELPLDLHLMQEALGDDYVILLRMHYLVAENFDLRPFQGFAFDLSDYEDIRDLYLISDILITDYSSVFFDYANLRRPMIFFTYDIDRYRDTLRGFYFDFEHHAPGPLVKTTEEVIDEVRRSEAADFSLPPSFESFYERFCALEDGESTRRVVERVFLGRNES